MRSSESYSTPQPFNAAIPFFETFTQHASMTDLTQTAPALAATTAKCFLCGNAKHQCSKCPARDTICYKCQKKGHFAKVCRGKPVKTDEVSAALWSPTLATVGAPETLQKSTATVVVNSDWSVQALFDSGSSESYIHPSLVQVVAISVSPPTSMVSMATTSLKTKTEGFCTVTLNYQGHIYKDFRLSVMPGLCSDLIQHDSVTFNYGGTKPPLSVCSFTMLNIEPPSQFTSLTSDCHPIVTKIATKPQSQESRL